MSFHDFNSLFLSLRAGNVDGLLNDVMGNSFLRKELDHLPSFLPNLRNWQINRLLLCVTLHPLLWNVLRNFNSFLHLFRNGTSLISSTMCCCKRCNVGIDPVQPVDGELRGIQGTRVRAWMHRCVFNGDSIPEPNADASEEWSHASNKLDTESGLVRDTKAGCMFNIRPVFFF